MENNAKVLSLEDFMNGERSLNLEGFTNIEKGMEIDQFNLLFPKTAFEIFTEQQLSAYIATAQQTIIKGEVEGVVDIVKAQVSTLNRFRVKDSEGNGAWLFVKKKSDEDIEKSHVSDAFQYSENFKFTKTGAEILKQMAKVKAKEESEKTAAKTKMIMLQEKLTDMPTEEVGDWSYRGFKDKIETMYRYPWGDCKGCYSEVCETPMMGNVAQEESSESKLRSKYNECVSKYIDACVEICYLDLYIDNIKETNSYELTPQQAAVLQF